MILKENHFLLMFLKITQKHIIIYWQIMNTSLKNVISVTIITGICLEEHKH